MLEDLSGERTSQGGLRSLVSLKSRKSGGSDKSNRRAKYSTPTTAELYKAQGIPLTKEKCKACIMGALVADSASLSLDRLSNSVFQSLVGLPEFDSHPEFFEASSNAEHTQQSRLSMYGNEILPLLQSLVTHGGLDGLHYTNTSFEFLKKYSGKKSQLAQRFLQSMERGVYFPAGVPFTSMQCLTKVPMLVARYAGKDEMAVKLRDAVRAHQNNAEALQLSLATAKILERVVLGCTIVEALTWSQSDGVLDSSSQKHVQTVLQSISTPHSVFVAKTGKTDRIPGAFMTSLHAAAISSTYEEAVRHTLKAGGSGMCGRAQLAGAFLAAEAAPEPLPDSWIARVAKYEEYEELAGKLITQRAIITILPP